MLFAYHILIPRFQITTMFSSNVNFCTIFNGTREIERDPAVPLMYQLTVSTYFVCISLCFHIMDVTVIPHLCTPSSITSYTYVHGWLSTVINNGNMIFLIATTPTQAIFRTYIEICER